jgi:hypothetical protein
MADVRKFLFAVDNGRHTDPRMGQHPNSGLCYRRSFVTAANRVLSLDSNHLYCTCFRGASIISRSCSIMPKSIGTKATGSVETRCVIKIVLFSIYSHSAGGHVSADPQIAKCVPLVSGRLRAYARQRDSTKCVWTILPRSGHLHKHASENNKQSAIMTNRLSRHGNLPGPRSVQVKLTDCISSRIPRNPKRDVPMAFLKSVDWKWYMQIQLMRGNV